MSVDGHQWVLIAINNYWQLMMSIDKNGKKSLNVKKVNVYAYAHKKIKYFDFSNDFWLLEIDQVIKTQENC